MNLKIDLQFTTNFDNLSGVSSYKLMLLNKQNQLKTYINSKEMLNNVNLKNIDDEIISQDEKNIASSLPKNTK